MRKLLSLLFVLLLASPFLMAQQRTGNIYGKILDEDGNPVPGVTVTLTGSKTAPLTSITSAEGLYRFVSLSPAEDYTVTAKLEGFKTATRENIIVRVGSKVEINLTMEMGALEEEVTVVAETPVVEEKKTDITQNVDRRQLQELPSARDPWVVLEMAPAVMVDRENIGGSESGQQAGFQAKGGGYNQWAMDGITITDPSAIASPSYYDFDAFEEMNITTGGADVTQQGGGVQINLVTRRGGNQLTLGGRFYFTDEKFQDSNLTDELRAEGVSRVNKVRNIKDYGFNMGGPFIQDRAWWWMSFGVQNIKTTNLYGVNDDTLLQNVAGKLNFQPIPENRFEAFIHIGNKEKWGRSSSYSFPGGWHQTGKFHFGSPIIKFQDEHMFGNDLFVSLKYSFSDAGFNLVPMDDEEMVKLMERDVKAGIWENTYYFYVASRPMNFVSGQATYFNDSLFGASHEMLFGFEWSDRRGEHEWRVPGNALVRHNYNTKTVDTDGDGVRDLIPEMNRFEYWRGWRDNMGSTSYTGFARDTVTVGNLNLLLGVRFDYQKPRVYKHEYTAVEDIQAWNDNVSSQVKSTLDSVMPGLEIPAQESDYSWYTWSPRLGLTYDIFGTGETIAKLNYSDYGEFMGTFMADYLMPTGAGGWMDFWWMDNLSQYGGNGDGIVQLPELYWTWGGDYTPKQVFDSEGNWLVPYNAAKWYMWGNYDIDNPQQLGDFRYTIDPDIHDSWRTREIILTLSHELMPDLGVAVDFTYRKRYNFRWNLEWDGENMDTLEDQSWYEPIQTIPSSVGGYDTHEAAGKQYYLRNHDYYYPRYRTHRPDYHQIYRGVTLRFNKRLSQRWMATGSFTYQMQTRHYGEKGYLNGQNMWALDGKVYAHSMGGGSGKISQDVFPRWMFKLAGLYQFPYGIHASFNLNAREGHIIPWTVDIQDTVNNPHPQWIGTDQTDYGMVPVYLEEYGKQRLDPVWKLHLRVEKVLNAGDYGKIYIMADMFNVTNNNMIERRYDKHHGTFYVSDYSFSKDATDFMANQVLNPRVIRFGVRFEF